MTALAERGRVSKAEKGGSAGASSTTTGYHVAKEMCVSERGEGRFEGRSFSFEGECAAAAHIGRTGMGEKEQARLIRGRTSQPATARVIHGIESKDSYRG